MIFGQKEFLDFEPGFVKDFKEIGLDPDFIIFANHSVFVVGINVRNALFEHIGISCDVAIVIKLKNSMKCLLLGFGLFV